MFKIQNEAYKLTSGNILNANLELKYLRTKLKCVEGQKKNMDSG